MQCGFIGFGAAAYGICMGLRQAGLEEAYFYKNKEIPPFSGLLAERVVTSGVQYTPDYAKLASCAKCIFSVVIGAAAVEVARQAAPYLTKDHLFVDMNTASPATKAEAAVLVEARGARYIDAVIMGSVEDFGHTVPIIASGKGAVEFALRFAQFGMNITVLNGDAGHAAAVKLLRSVFQKGMMCLFIEMFLAARVCGVEKTVIASISKTFDGIGLESMAERIIPKAVNGAARMRTEMSEVQAALENMGLPSYMSTASTKWFNQCSQLDLLDLPYETLNQTLSALQEALVVKNL